MSRKLLRAGVWGVLAILASGAGKVVPKSLPDFSVIIAAANRHMEGLPHYQPGGILARGEVAALGPRLQSLGWLPDDWASLVQRVPADESFLVQKLRTPAGRRFAARIGKYPLGYDRVDRLSRLPDGRETVNALVRGPDGDKLIGYMATQRGGKNLGRQLAHGPRGAHFNSPTGQIYTLADLLKALKTRHDAAKNPPKARPARS